MKSRSWPLDLRMTGSSAGNKLLIHGLVERSRQRAVQVRAGHSLAHVLEQDAAQAEGSLTHLPKLHGKTGDEEKDAVASDLGLLRKHVRKRATILKPPQQQPLPADEAEPSLVQFQHYVSGKPVRMDTLRHHQRRKAVAKQSKNMQKAAQLAAKHESPAGAEPVNVKFTRALAKLNGQRAFLHANELAPPPDPDAELFNTKNAHQAFLEFKADASCAVYASTAAGLGEGNTIASIPLRFGDEICFISQANALPLSIGLNGRSQGAANRSVGPHMTFTITDFRDPSRDSEVTDEDDVWLRMDPSSIKSDSVKDEGSLVTLVSETQHFVGCPGTLENGDIETGSPVDLGSIAKKYTTFKPAKKSKEASTDLFRLVAMKALVPSEDFYGDDDATREYTIETNESVYRLARWRIVVHRHLHEHERMDAAVMHCDAISLVVNDLVLEQDAQLERAVGRDLSKRVQNAGQTTTQFLQRSFHRRSAGSSACWQVRLLHRHAPPPVTPANSPAKTTAKRLQQEDADAAAQRLRLQQHRVERNDQRIREKRMLARKAHKDYDLVAHQSNSKLAEIEQHKKQNQLAYFQHRYQALDHEDSDGGSRVVLPAI